MYTKYSHTRSSHLLLLYGNVVATRGYTRYINCDNRRLYCFENFRSYFENGTDYTYVYESPDILDLRVCM